MKSFIKDSYNVKVNDKETTTVDNVALVYQAEVDEKDKIVSIKTTGYKKVDTNVITPNDILNVTADTDTVTRTINPVTNKLEFQASGSGSAGVSSLNQLTGAIEVISKPQVDFFTGLQDAIDDETDNNPIGIDVSPQSNQLLLGFDINKVIDGETIVLDNDTRKIKAVGGGSGITVNPNSGLIITDNVLSFQGKFWTNLLQGFYDASQKPTTEYKPILIWQNGEAPIFGTWNQWNFLSTQNDPDARNMLTLVTTGAMSYFIEQNMSNISTSTLTLDGSSRPNWTINLTEGTQATLAKAEIITTTGDGTQFLSNDGTYKEVGSGGQATSISSNSLTVTGSGTYDVSVELSSSTQSTLALAQSQLYHVAQADIPYTFDNTYCVLNSLSMDGNNLNFNISWNTAVNLEANQTIDILTMNTGIVGEKILYETTNGKVSFIGNKLSFINKSSGTIIMLPAGNVFTGPVALTVPVVSPTYVDEQLTLLNNTITSFVNNKFMSRYGKGFTGSSADSLLLKTEVKTTFTPWIIETFLDCDGWMWKIQWTGLSKSNQICNIFQLYATSNTHKVYGTDWYFEMSKTEQSICIHKNNPTSFNINTTLLALSENAYRAYVDYQGQSGAGDWTQITPTIL